MIGLGLGLDVGVRGWCKRLGLDVRVRLRVRVRCWGKRLV